MSKQNNGSNAAVSRSKSLTERFSDVFERLMPDSMTIAFILVLLVAAMAIVFAGAPLFVSTETKMSVADSIAERFWSLLTFSMQMALITVLGNVFASSPPMKKLLRKFCALPKTTISAYVLCAALSYALSWCHWAVGWMGCIVIGKEMLLQAKRRGIKIHTPSFVAALFCTALMGGTAISASHILYASTPGYLQQLVDPSTAALMKDSYSIVDTVLYAKPLIMGILSFAIVLAIIMAMRPKKGAPIEEMTEEQEAFYSIEVDYRATDKSSIAKRLSNSMILQYMIVALMGYWVFMMLITEGFVGISIDKYNYLVLTACLAFCMRPRVFVELFTNTVSSAWAFIIQYPFYAGIFGIIVCTGLDEVISGFFLSFATTKTWPSVAFLYSAILNIFVPSAGSKFIVEAPYIIPITFTLDSNLPTILQAYGFGDCATNMLTPFWWILPCGLFRIDYHKVLPYAVVASLGVSLFCFIGFFFW